MHALVRRHVQITAKTGVYPQVKVACLVAGMAAGADSIDGLDMLRHGAMPDLFGGVRAPSMLGSFLRSFTWGNVRQLERVDAQRQPGVQGQQAGRLASSDHDRLGMADAASQEAAACRVESEVAAGCVLRLFLVAVEMGQEAAGAGDRAGRVVTFECVGAQRVLSLSAIAAARGPWPWTSPMTRAGVLSGN